MLVNLSLRREQFEKAALRAKKLKLKATELLSDGHLVRVESSSVAGRWYLVELLIDRRGDIVASCDCPAGRASFVCHHMAAAGELYVEQAKQVDEFTQTEIEMPEDETASPEMTRPTREN